MSLKVDILQESFRKVKPQADAFVDSFYENLFTDYPASRPLFQHSDMKKQVTMLKACLLLVVENLRHPDRMQEVLGSLGTRHVRYGALPEHYPLVGNSLLKTFEQYLKQDWTPEVKDAWTEAYAAITALMLEGCDYSEESVDLDSVPSPAPKPAKMQGLEPVVSISSPGREPQSLQRSSTVLKRQNQTAVLPQSSSNSSADLDSDSLPSPETTNVTGYYTESNFPAFKLASSIVGSGVVILLFLLLI